MLPSLSALQSAFKPFHQDSFFARLSHLSLESQAKILKQLTSLNLSLLAKQQNLFHSDPSLSDSFQPFEHFAYTGNQANKERGQQSLEAGEAGCVVLAGGQGSRLGSSGPKGLFPLSICQHKSLFQLIAEKVRAASSQVQRPLPLAIMTSPQNDAETQAYFNTHRFFGLDPQQVDFFVQEELPLLDAKGQLFLEAPHQLAQGPDGNGRCWEQFIKAGVYAKWLKQGICYVNLILVDNPLAIPFDPELLGFHIRQQNDITLKCTEKNEPHEKVGLVVQEQDKCRVIEYSEMPSKEKEARLATGALKHRCANLSLFCLSMEFVKHVGQSSEQLPLHKAWKAVAYLNEQGETVVPDQPNAWKFETFIFDILPLAHKVSALLYPRHLCFAPLKNKTGQDSPETVRQAIQTYEAQLIQTITGHPPLSFPFELAPEFYYPSDRLLKDWQGKQLSTIGYIEP